MNKGKEMWKRNCPKCGKEIFYTEKCSKIRAEVRNTNCMSCIMVDRFLFEDARKKISESKKGIIFSNKHKKKMSKNHADVSGENNPMYGKCAYDIWVGKYGKEEADKRQIESNRKNSKSSSGKNSPTKRPEVRKKLRLSAIKNIENRCGQISPNYNPKAIPIIRKKAKELGIDDLQHAENGGEYQVCGYFVDGFSPSKNIVIEYYEPFHKKQVERDERRKQEIINHLGCKFIEIKESVI